MSTELIILITFGCAALFAAAVLFLLNDVFFRYRSALVERTEQIAGRAKIESGGSILDLTQLAAAASASSARNWRSALRDQLEQSGIHLSLQMMLIISFSLAGCLIAIVTVASGCWPVGLVAGGVGFCLPWGHAQRKRNSRIRKMTHQLPDVFDTMARAVRAGQTVPGAFQMIADEFRPPISEEFWRCYEQQNLGISSEAALREMARRSPVMELRILVVALLVQSRSGGNLIELLSSLATMVRQRLRLQQRMKALTGEARMQAAVLIVLPIVAFFAVIFLSRDYANALLERPWLLGGTACSVLIGAVWIRKAIQLEV